MKSKLRKSFEIIMTEMGTFIINGGENVLLFQLVRSPGVYFNDKAINGKSGVMWIRLSQLVSMA